MLLAPVSAYWQKLIKILIFFSKAGKLLSNENVNFVIQQRNSSET